MTRIALITGGNRGLGKAAAPALPPSCAQRYAGYRTHDTPGIAFT